ncbi:unnamed protein product [Nesidiocoris tenuis]|uniref:Venom dipeptidyl peptidase 4 n=1 Tax=Nesidiocoris tenuis TaxID=355587 RepID=A0A6H5HEI2_9HEMI|nr:unnamed protein product [Nesidiocoris tenuis]
MFVFGFFDDTDCPLVSSNENQRNWRGILIAVLVIASVLALIVTSVVLLTPPDQGPKIKPGRLKLSQILSHQLTPYLFNGSWISGDELMYRDEYNNIAVMEAINQTVRIVMNNQTYLFRHSFLAQYTVFDVQNGQTFSVTVTDRDNDRPFLVHAQWSRRGHGLFIILDYDIYYRPHPRLGQVYRITNTAIPGLIHNGVPDWLYEEEILNDNKAIWNSKDGHILLYASFNDTLVQEFQFPWYGVSQDTAQLYPQIRSLRYPKPGTTNPHVTLFVADLADLKDIKTRQLKPPIAFQQAQTTDYYFNGASWVSATEVAVIWMNRAQNISMVTICKSPMWYCQETQRITGEGAGWVEAPPPPIFSDDGNTYLTLAPVQDGTAGYFRHIVSVNIPKKRFMPITHGTYEVYKISAWDIPNNKVYGGPGSQLVVDKWKIDWATYLASTQDIIIGYIDGRGTSGKGYSLTHQVYMKLGTVEASDQLEVTEYLRDNLHYIDQRRVGVWGWSYGGFVAALLLSHPGQDVFQCGAAVAPITSWRLYDSAYTERYMGLPNVTDNYKGYEETELSKRVDGLKDKSLYLVHGTADDNVHLHQGLHFARALSNAGVVYRQQIYPDENHSLSGVKHHLYRSMGNFFSNCFKKQVPQESKAGLRNGGSEWDMFSKKLKRFECLGLAEWRTFPDDGTAQRARRLAESAQPGGSMATTVGIGVLFLSLNLMRDCKLHLIEYRYSALVINHITLSGSFLITALNLLISAFDPTVGRLAPANTDLLSA